MQNAKSKTESAGPRAGLACTLCAVCCVLFLSACMAPAAYQAPAQSQVAPPAASQEVTLAGGGGTDVLAEGAASDSAASTARDHALKDALRKAVEQGVGAFVNSETKVEDFQLLSDKVYSQASDYVSSYHVIAEGRDSGLYRVTIRARVKLGKIDKELAAIDVPPREQGRPRVMVAVKETPKDDILAVDDRMLETGVMETMIVDAFQSRGFPVVDPATVRQNLQKNQLRRILEGDNQAAVEVGLGTEADVVVAGTVQESRERRAAANAAETTDFVKIRLSARAINTATGENLGSTLLELEGPFSEDMARQRAADSAGAELSARILETWRGRTNITEIYADNADYQRVQLLKSTITQETHGVDSVVTRSLVGRSAVVEVFSEVSSDQLLTQINRCTTVIPFSVKTFSGNRIDIRFLDAPEKCEPELK